MKRIDFDNGSHTYVVESAGLIPTEEMHFHEGITRCGKITDGVSFNLGRGGWVIPFSELEQMYQAAVARRAVVTVASE